MKSLFFYNSQIHRIINDFITITTLFDLSIIPSSKGCGNELRRKIKDLYIYNKYYLNNNEEDIINLYRFFLSKYHFKGSYSEKFQKIIYFFDKQQHKNFKIAKKLLNNKDKAMDTYGIPKEFYGYKESLIITDYNFDK